MARSFITTYPEHLAETGDRLVESYNKFYDNKIHVYADYKIEVDAILHSLDTIESLKKVKDKWHHIISPFYGGSANESKMSGWEKRWYGWFHKVAVIHYHLTNYTDDILFLDSDIIIKGKMPQELWPEADISFFNGDRDFPDTGLLFINNTEESRGFVCEWLEMYAGGKAFELPVYSDIHTLKYMLDTRNISRQDLAAGVSMRIHTNSSGHTTGGQVICCTEYAKFFEHDKGLHWRKKVVPF